MKSLISRLREYASTRKGELAELITEAADALERQTCDDAVSRQQAVDALIEQMPSPFTADGSHPADEGIFRVQETYADCIETIKLLPSAQPEIIRCKDCRFQDKGCNEAESWNLCGYRPWLHVPTEDEHYCGYAVRKENR